MSVRHEQYRALKTTKELLYDILTVENYPKGRREMRRRALACLRHYPFMDKDGKPHFSRN